ncbi:MAG: molybdate ABC transporter substrate-binding protein [Polyangiales bacterium]
MSWLCSVVAFSLVAFGCGGETNERTLDVFAASSLRPAFEELAGVFEAEHSEWRVRFNFAGSQVLRMQLEEGARAAVFASADEAQMRGALAARPGVQSEVFASNALVLAVSGESSIRSMEDLPAAARLVIGTEASPIGVYSRRLLDAAAVRYGEDYRTRTLSNVVSEESNAGLVRAKVELGAADAALIYASDTEAARFRVIALPDELQIAAPYRMAVLEDSPAGEAFARLLRSAAGRAVLSAHGFELP